MTIRHPRVYVHHTHDAEAGEVWRRWAAHLDRLIGNGGGYVYAPLGPTHEAIEDLAIMRALPNMTVTSVCDADEMTRLEKLVWFVRGRIRTSLSIPLAPAVDAVCYFPTPKMEAGLSLIPLTAKNRGTLDR